MQFHKTSTIWDEQKDQVQAPSWVPELKKAEIFYAARLDRCKKAFASIKKRGEDVLNLLRAEYLWIRNRRPYYKVYPAIVEALCRLKLNEKYECPEIPQGQLSVRFAVGHEPQTKDGIRICALFLTNLGLRTPSGRESKGITVEADLLNPPNKEDFHPFLFTMDPNPHFYDSVEDLIERGQDPNCRLFHEDSLSAKKEVQALATRIALTVCMLRDDPDIITPDILVEDERRYEKASDEWKRKAEKRARKRGKIGWNIGKEMETVPHFRRPHLAIRHTGPNRTVPKVVRVKACTVHRDKLTKVPTGYVLPDGTEVEEGKALAAP